MADWCLWCLGIYAHEDWCGFRQAEEDDLDDDYDDRQRDEEVVRHGR